MKNNLYYRFQRRLTLLFLLCTVLTTCILLLIISLISYRASYLASAGALKEVDFLYFYRQHSWEMNTFLFAGAFALLLYVFIRSFFTGMDALMLLMQGKAPIRTPFFFRVFPELREASAKVEDMKAQREYSRQLSLEEKEHKNELLMYLAHDLKTPLTSMIGYINHILDHHLKEQEEAEALHIAGSKAYRLDHLLDEFSEMIRYDDRVSHLEIASFDLSALLHQQLAGFYPLMEKKELTLESHIEAALLMEGDYDKLQRVFDNLLRNALNYSLPATPIVFSAIEEQEKLHITCCNVSEGLDDEAVSHLFDKFYRASSARTSTSGGAGLGLAIAKEIITLHHGTITAAVRQQQIIFDILLPKRQEERL